MPDRTLLLVIALVLASCAPVRKEQMASDGVVMPNSMCAKKGTAAMSKDAPGQRMVCELEDPVGSHLPKCICRDELAMDADREATQRYLQEAEQTKQPLKGN